MKKYLLISIIAFFTLFSSNLNAQELKNYNLYNHNPILYNPAFAIEDNFLMAYTNYHLQWASFDGAPRSYDLGATMNFYPNMGVGFSINSVQQGLLSNLYANLKYGYKIDFAEEHYVKMGVSFGIANDRVMAQNAQNVDLSDDHLTSDYYNKTVFSSGFGFAYKNKNINAQLILPQLFEYNSLNLYTIGVIGYDYHLNDEWDLKPSIMFRGAKASPFQIDGNIAATWNKMVWGQAGYRSNKSLIVSVGVNISNYSIGYAYQADINPIAAGSAGSHEIQLIYRFNNKDKTLFTPKVNLFGVVTSNLDGMPVEAEISIYEDKSYVDKLRTPENTGAYDIELDADKTYKLKITARGYHSKEDIITLTKNIKDYEHNIVLISKNAIISGQITNKINGQPVEAEIMFLENNRIIKKVQSDIEGNYSTELEKNKNYTIKINAENYKEFESEISVEENAEKITKNFELTPVLSLSGIITNANTGTPISANIDLYDNATNQLVANIQADEDGNYSLNIPEIEYISISISSENYLFHTENIEIDFSNFETTKDFMLKPIEIGASIVLKNIFFDVDKSNLRPESYIELDRLVFVMNQNPNLEIQISGHTDNTGSDAYNKRLSKDRAQSVVDYLVSKGIKKEKLTSVGYGQSKPIDTNDTEEGKQNNRRVEAEITKI